MPIIKLYGREVLDNALYENGLISFPTAGYQWVLKRERMGRLVCPRDPSTGHRKFTREQIDEIIKTFSPGGSGKYFYGKTNK